MGEYIKYFIFFRSKKYFHRIIVKINNIYIYIYIYIYILIMVYIYDIF